MIYFISLSEGARWIKVKCPAMKYETLLKKLDETGLKEFTVLFRNGKVWDCNLTRIYKREHNWRHFTMKDVDWRQRYKELSKFDLAKTEHSNIIEPKTFQYL